MPSDAQFLESFYFYSGFFGRFIFEVLNIYIRTSTSLSPSCYRKLKLTFSWRVYVEKDAWLVPVFPSSLAFEPFQLSHHRKEINYYCHALNKFLFHRIMRQEMKF